jgi:hypothetical protein
MGSSPDNFDSLEKLLRLKRYEKPHPRYFNDFSGRVMSRIEAGEARGSWWERFGFDLRPAFAAAAGLFACGLVVYGVATAGDGIRISNDFVAAGNTGPALSSDSSPNALLTHADSSMGSSTNPVPSFGTPIDRNVFPSGSVIPASFPVQ